MSEQDGKLHKCAHPDCDEMVGPDDFCPGCNDHVCLEHSGNVPFGKHSVEDHWDNCDVCGEHVSVCHCNEGDNE